MVHPYHQSKCIKRPCSEAQARIHPWRGSTDHAAWTWGGARGNRCSEKSACLLNRPCQWRPLKSHPLFPPPHQNEAIRHHPATADKARDNRASIIKQGDTDRGRAGSFGFKDRGVNLSVWFPPCSRSALRGDWGLKLRFRLSGQPKQSVPHPPALHLTPIQERYEYACHCETRARRQESKCV
jgi:hypothetical protein